MELNVDTLINFFKDYSRKNPKKEFTEQETAGGGASGGSGKTPRKWSSNIKRGKTWMGDSKYVWKSDLTRGPANQLFYDS